MLVSPPLCTPLQSETGAFLCLFFQMHVPSSEHWPLLSPHGPAPDPRVRGQSEQKGKSTTLPTLHGTTFTLVLTEKRLSGVCFSFRGP